MRPVIVFDLDGTLVDSLPDIVASFLQAFPAVGLAAPEEGAVRATLGQPLETMYRAFAPTEHVDALCDSYRAHYDAHMADHSRPYPGVPELLTELGRRGYLRAVASTKRTDTARRLVQATGLAGLLDHVEGSDAAPYKPAPDVVLRAVEAAGGRGAWMVGDTAGDVLAGRAAGLRTYAVSWGTHGEEALASARPDALEPDLTALPSLL
ncbi:MAG: HAD-IA family hydrolase [Deinococcales bacterium]